MTTTASLFDELDTRPGTPADTAAGMPASAFRLRPREATALQRALAAARAAGHARAVFDSPVGPLLAIASAAGLHSLWFLDEPPEPALLEEAGQDPAGSALIERLREQLAAYFAGARTRFDVALAPRGTPFQESVWRRLVEIDCGTTVSYGRIARDLGNPAACRAVGLAVGRNPISILVPCHRVIGEDGTLTGYAGGLHRKRFLLGLELGPETLPVSARRPG